MLTIGLATRNRPLQLAAWLAHIATVDGGQTVPIIIIDQSELPTRYGIPANVRYVHAPGTGIAQARNRILGLAQTAVVAFCDDDCRPAQDWILVATHVATERPDIVLWFGATFPSGEEATIHDSPTYSGTTTWASRPDGHICQALRVGGRFFETNVPCPILEHLGQGNNMLVRIGTRYEFEPLLGVGAPGASAEDVEYALHMLHRGYPCAYEPRLRMTHDAWMPPDVSARAGHGATCGMVAVHVWYAWYGSAVARAEAAFRLHLIHPLQTDHAIPFVRLRHRWDWYVRECLALGWGIVLGCWLAVRRGAPWRR